MNPQWRLSDIIFQVSILLKESLNMVVMVNNSTNINTSNKRLLQQIIEHKKTMIYDIGNPGPVLGQAEKRW